MFLKHYPPVKVRKAIFSVKIKVKITRSLILVQIERASFYAIAKNEVSISHASNIIAKVKVDDRKIETKTEMTKPISSRSFILGYEKSTDCNN